MGERWISFGSLEVHAQELVRAAAIGKPIEWTVHQDARPGDDVLFYLTNPVYAFIATGKVEKRSPEDWPGLPDKPRPQAFISQIRLLPSPITIQAAKVNLPHAKWLKAPSGFATRPCPPLDYDAIVKMGTRTP
jgi:hypothetical protein